jgi:hypothetical protein
VFHAAIVAGRLDAITPKDNGMGAANELQLRTVLPWCHSFSW